MHIAFFICKHRHIGSSANVNNNPAECSDCHHWSLIQQYSPQHHSISTASTVIVISHVLIFLVIFICQFAALQNGNVGGIVKILTFVSFIFLLCSLLSVVGLCTAFANENSNWLSPLLYLVILSIFYFAIMACLTIAAMAAEGPSMEFMRAMYSNTPNYSDALIKKFSSFKVFLREVMSLRLAIFLFVHIFATVFDCAAFGVVLLCVEYLTTKKPANNQAQGGSVELSHQPLIGGNADAVQRLESDNSQTSQYIVLPPTFKLLTEYR